MAGHNVLIQVTVALKELFTRRYTSGYQQVILYTLCGVPNSEVDLYTALQYIVWTAGSVVIREGPLLRGFTVCPLGCTYTTADTIPLSY